MRLLLDENIPVKLKRLFSDVHEITTVKEQQWSGIKNGKLLSLMISNGFDGLVTMDRNLRYQQNLDKHEIRIVVLNAKDNKLMTLQPFVSELESQLAHSSEKKVLEINIEG